MTSDDQDVVALNDLLNALDIPILIASPLDLTPSLLIAILESMLQERVPLLDELRNSQSHSAKVAAMKVFLGVFSENLLGIDVGLGDIDPRRLAEGSYDEVIFVGRMLVWTGAKLGITRHSPSDDDDDINHPSVEYGSIASRAGSANRAITSPHQHDSTLGVSAITSASHNYPLHYPHTSANHSTKASSSASWLRHTASSPTPTHDVSYASSHGHTMTASTCDCSDMHLQDELTHCSCTNHDRDPDTEQHHSSPPKHNTSPLPIGHSTPTSNRKRAVSPRDHELDILSDVFISPPHATLSCSLSPLGQVLPYRSSGWIQRVEGEIEDYEAQSYRSISVSHDPGSGMGIVNVNTPRELSQTPLLYHKPNRVGPTRTRDPIAPTAVLARHNSPTQQTVALLQERARLLYDLSKLNLSHT